MEKDGYPEDMYTEVHHILPKCQGGTNDKSNLVRMPVRYHIMAHILLSKAYPDNIYLAYSAHILMECKNGKELFSTRLASMVRENFRKSRIGTHHSDETKRKISESQKGKIISKEHVERLRLLNTGRKHSEETRKKMSESHKKENLSAEVIKKISMTSKGRRHSEETKQKISLANTGKVFSKEHRENISKSKKGKPGKKHTKEELEKMSKNKLRKKVQGPDGTIYDSMKICSEINKICRDTLRKWINKYPEKGFKYYNN